MKLHWAVALLIGKVLSETQLQKQANGTTLKGMFRDLVTVKHEAESSADVEVNSEAASDQEEEEKVDRKPITCKFTMDNNVDSVFYAGKDITSSVKGSTSNWKEVKQFTIGDPVDDAYLVIAGHNHENDNRACKTGGFMIKCDNGISSGSAWEAYGSYKAIYGPQATGKGSRWTTPCQSSSGFYLEDPSSKKRINVRKIFATNKKFAAFRIQLRGAPPLRQPVAKDPISCTFTIDNFVDSVYYDGKDITKFVAGNLADWKSVKRVTVDKKPGAYFVVSGHNHERNSCKTGGFQIKCSNGVTSSNPQWQAFGSDRTVYGPQKDGRGGGWQKPCASSSGFKLQTAPNVKKVFATDKPFASFRIQLVPVGKAGEKGPPTCLPPPSPDVTHGKECPQKKAALCLRNNKAYGSIKEAWDACGSTDGCAFILSWSNGKYYLRRSSDPDVKDGKGYLYKCASAITTTATTTAIATTTATTTNTAAQVIQKLKEKLKISNEKLQNYKSDSEESNAKLQSTKAELQKSNDKLKKEQAMNSQLENVLSKTRAEKERLKERTSHVDEMYAETQKHLKKVQEANSDLYKLITETRAKAPTFKHLKGGWNDIMAAKKDADMAKQKLRDLGTEIPECVPNSQAVKASSLLSLPPCSQGVATPP